MEEIASRNEKIELNKIETFSGIDEQCDGCLCKQKFWLSIYLAMMDIKRLYESIKQPKTHLELVKIMNEVAPGKESIAYEDFVSMILGKKNSVLKLYI